jgi:hypothetical protein
MQQMVSGSPRLCPAHRQQVSRTCSHESKRLRKLADEGRNQAPSPQRGGCRTLSSPTGRSTSRSSQRLLQDGLQIVVQDHLLADQAFDGKQLDHLVLVPNGKLATVRLHLEEDAPSGHLRTEGVGGQIDIDAAIATHMTQIYLLIQCCKPGVWVNPRMASAGTVGKTGKATRGGTLPQARP